MLLETIQEKIHRAEIAVEKQKAIVQKHQARLAKALTPYEIEKIKSSLSISEEKLREKEKALERHQQLLKNEEIKLKFIDENTPDAIKKFMEEWKQESIKTYQNRFMEYVNLKKNLQEEKKRFLFDIVHKIDSGIPIETKVEFDLSVVKENIERHKNNSNGSLEGLSEYTIYNYILKPKLAYALLSEQDLSDRCIADRLHEFGGSIVEKMHEKDDGEREIWLEKLLEKEKQKSINDLIVRIYDITGKITDAKYLHVNPANWVIEGYVTGEKGKASIEVIGAGGWNIQRYHLRILVHEIK